MSKIKKLASKTKAHFTENGMRDTMQHISEFIMRRVRLKLSNEIEYKVPAVQKGAYTPKNHPTIFIVAGVPYQDIGGGQRCAQLLKTFNKMGYSVEYVYALIHNATKNEELMPPATRHAYLDKKTLQHIRVRAKENDIFIFEAPIAAMEPVVDIAIEKNCKIIYENIDNWETTLGEGFFNEVTVKKMLSAADLLVGTAEPLVDQIEEYLEKYNIQKDPNQIIYLANAVDENLFCGMKSHHKPEDLVQGTKTLLYYGSLWGEWFEWNLVIELAERNPEYAINLIGSITGIKKVIETCPKNIHFLGLKNQTELPAYLQYVDYALLPFERGEIGDYVSPLKIFEYIAMYARVLSTPLPDIAGYPNVFFGDTVEAWEAIIEQDPVADQDAAELFTENNTWTSRIIQMLEYLNVIPAESMFKENLTIIVSPHKEQKINDTCLTLLHRYQEHYGYQIVVIEQDEVKLSDVKTDYVLYLDATQWPTNPYWLKAYEDVAMVHPDFECIGCVAEVTAINGGPSTYVNGYDLSYMPPQMLCRNDVTKLYQNGLLIHKGGTGKYNCPYLGVRKAL